MNILRSIFSLPAAARIAIIAGSLALNAAYGFAVARYISRYHRKQGDVTGAMTRYRILSQYLYIPLLFVFTLFITLSAIAFIRVHGIAGKTASMTAAFTSVFLLLMENQLVYYRTITHIRETSASFAQHMGTTLRQLALGLLPVLVINVFFQLSSSFSNAITIQIVFLSVFVLLINAASPWLYTLVLKARPLEDSPRKQALTSLLQTSDIRRAELYAYPGKSQKQANALVTGLMNKRIFISDYLMDHLDDAELAAILGHEIGHMKKRHVPARIGLVLLVLPLVFGLVALLEYAREYLYLSIPRPLEIGLLAALILSYIVGLRLWLFRRQEYAADAYSCSLGSTPSVMAGALRKLAALNHSAQNLHALDEKLQTHPSIARRVSRLEAAETKKPAIT
ncbi:MAG: M48 family metalloprotease [Spirochaetales bacterium]|nr:M48 family metalloprotease [Spirochaetales bacterium]